MRVIIKYIIKNMWEKRLRTVLILFSVMASCGLFFSSSAIGDTFAQMYIDRIKVFTGNTDIIVEPTTHSPSQWVQSVNLAGEENIECAVGCFYAGASYRNGAYESINLTIMGIEWADLQKMNPVELIDEYEMETFSGMKIVLSREFCEKYGYSAGDSINLTVNGGLRKFVVTGIATGGNFVDDGFSIFAVVPADTVSALHNALGTYNSLQIILKDENMAPMMIEKLSDIYKGYEVREPFNSEDIKREVASMATPFMLMTIIVAFMSMFIIFTSFKVITMERLPVIGTFRSIGATKKTTDYIMLSESILYGVIGSGLGVGLGILILRVMSEMMKDPWVKNMKSAVAYTPAQITTSFLFGVILCFFSSFIPIVQVSRIPLKDIILNTMDKAVNKKSVRFIVGVILVAVSIILPSRLPKDLALPLSIACMLMSIVSIILLVPFITGLFGKILEKLYIFLLGNVGVLAAKNLRENKSILNNISLLSIGIASLLMINLISYSVSVEVVDFYSKARYDLTFSSNSNNAHMERLLERIEGVEDTYGFYELSGVEVSGQDAQITTFLGVDYRKYFEYWDFPIQPESEGKLPELEQGRTIFLTNILKERYGVEEGELLTLNINKHERNYTVAGFFNSLYNNGSLALISDKYFKVDTGYQHYSEIYVKTNVNADEAAERIKKELSHYSPWIMTMGEMKENNEKSNDQMFVLLKGFSLLAMLIGIVGVVNNLLISFIQRRRQFAIFRSIGMEKGQTVRMILIEAFTGGVIGGTSGVLAGLLLCYIVQYVMIALNLPAIVHYPLDVIITSGIAGLVIMLAASLGPAVKSSRLNIIDAIKYE